MVDLSQQNLVQPSPCPRISGRLSDKVSVFYVSCMEHLRTWMRQCDSGGKAQVLVSAHLTQRMIEGEEGRDRDKTMTSKRRVGDINATTIIVYC